MTAPTPTRRVLVTRAPGSWPSLLARFQGTDVAVDLAATTEQVEPLDPAPGDRAIAALPTAAWLVVTSGKGVKALELRLAARGRALPPRVKVAALGTATARALRGVNVRVDLVAEEAHGAGLAKALAPRLAPGESVVVVRPEGVAPGELHDTVRRAGALVIEAPLYRTVASADAPRLAAATIAGWYAGIAVTAPSGLLTWLEAAGPRRAPLLAALRGMRRVAIGPTTARALASAGLRAHAVAAAPEEEAVGDAIARALSERSAAPATMPPPRGGPS